MYRVFRVTIVALGVVALTACGQTARADLLTKDSSSFSWKYEMTADPTGQDLDTNVGYDFSTVLGSPTLSGGIASFSGLATYASVVATPPLGEVWQNISYANGYTIEVRLKSAQSSAQGVSASVGILGCSETTKCSQLFVGDTGQYWGETSGGHLVSLGTADNAGDFHVFRIAQLPDQDSFSVWRDGQLLSGALTSAYTATDVTPLLYVGQAVAGEAVNGATQLDYIRITSGAYAPVPEPMSLVMLASMLIGLVAYAWRNKK